MRLRNHLAAFTKIKINNFYRAHNFKINSNKQKDRKNRVTNIQTNVAWYSTIDKQISVSQVDFFFIFTILIWLKTSKKSLKSNKIYQNQNQKKSKKMI